MRQYGVDLSGLGEAPVRGSRKLGAEPTGTSLPAGHLSGSWTGLSRTEFGSYDIVYKNTSRVRLVMKWED
jgi:hypothetical protein